MTKTYPKILVLGETFHMNSGGGITLSNLFKDWPKDCIANATDYRHPDMSVGFESIQVYELYKHKTILRIFKYNQIGKFRVLSSNKKHKSSTSKKTIKYFLKNLYFNILSFTNLQHIMYRYKLDSNLIDWISEFQPDFVYSQLGSIESILLIKNIHEVTNIPIAVHFMDDWPSWYGTRGLFKSFWKNKINNELISVLDSTSIFLSISESMSEEYQKRYNKKFIHFHNPIDVEKWDLCRESDLEIGVKRINILHAGRIGNGIKKSLIETANAIQILRNESYDITLQIQSSFIDQSFVETLSQYDCVQINPPAQYNEIPSILATADILIILNDFDDSSVSFLRYSIPTKLSEYMISKVPILVYSNSESAVYQFVSRFNVALTVGANNIDALKEGILKLILNKELAEKLVLNAYNYATGHFDAKKVRERFRCVFINNMHHEILKKV